MATATERKKRRKKKKAKQTQKPKAAPKKPEHKFVMREPGEKRYERIYFEDDNDLGIIADERWQDTELGGEARANYVHHLERYEMAVDYVRVGSTVADLGCGSGYGCDMMAMSGAKRVLGLDRDKLAVEYAQKHARAKNVKFAQHDITTQLPISSCYCDLVTCMEAIEHVEEGAFVMKEAYRILRPGGTFLVSTPLRRIKEGETEEVTRNEYHLKEYSSDEWLEMLNETFDEWGMYVHTSEGFLKWDGEPGLLVLAVCHKRAKQTMAGNSDYKDRVISARLRAGELNPIGRIIKQDDDMEYLITFHDVVSTPQPDGLIEEELTEFMVRDLTREATPENVATMESGGNVYYSKEPIWRDHFNRNKAIAKAGRWKREDTLPKQADVVYIVGTSPNLRKNGHLLADVKNGFRLGLNGAAALVGPDSLDMMITLETENSTADTWWWHNEDGSLRDFSKMELACPITANPKLTEYGFKDLRWFIHPGHNPLYDEIMQEFNGALMLDAGFGVSYSALNYAGLMNPKAIVLVGHDCSFPEVDGVRLMHAAGERPREKNSYIVNAYEIEIPTLGPEKFLTNTAYEQIARNLTWVSFFFLRKGIRFINATEGGIVYQDFPDKGWGIERKTLNEVMEEFEK